MMVMMMSMMISFEKSSDDGDDFDEDEDYLLTFLPSLLITISSIFRSQATSISHTGC